MWPSGSLIACSAFRFCVGGKVPLAATWAVVVLICPLPIWAQETPEAVRVDTLTGGRIVVSNPSSAGGGHTIEGWRVTEELRITYVVRLSMSTDYNVLAGDTLFLETRKVELDVSPEGWLWARREDQGDGSAWDLFDNCGAYRGEAITPLSLASVRIGWGGVVHGVVSDALDVDYVVRLRVDKPDGSVTAAATCPF